MSGAWFWQTPEKGPDAQAIQDKYTYMVEEQERELELSQQDARIQAIDYALRLTEIITKNLTLKENVDIGELVITSAEKFTQYILDGRVKKERKRRKEKENESGQTR